MFVFTLLSRAEEGNYEYPRIYFLLDFANLFEQFVKNKKRCKRILTSPFKIAFPYSKNQD